MNYAQINFTLKMQDDGNSVQISSGSHDYIVTVNNLQALIELVESYSITGLISGAEKTISYRFKVVEFHLTFS